MGVYLNPSSRGFQMSRQSQTYVDKSGLIAELNKIVSTEERFVCISRPRRFGKTMAANMIAAYYCSAYDSHELFSGLKIENDPSFEAHMNKYNVVMLDMASFLTEAKSGGGNKEECQSDSLVKRMEFLIIKSITDDLLETMPDFPLGTSDGIVKILNKADALTGKPFVMIIDEWDCLFRELEKDRKSQKEYLDFIRLMLEDKSYVALAYMTGILPTGRRPELGIFEDYSAIQPAQYGEYLGFTVEETQSLRERHNMLFGAVLQMYQGYLAEGVGPVFNPLSVVSACKNHDCLQYWAQTERSEVLRMYIDMKYGDMHDTVIRLFYGNRVKIDTTRFKNEIGCKPKRWARPFSPAQQSQGSGRHLARHDRFRTKFGLQSPQPLLQVAVPQLSLTVA